MTTYFNVVDGNTEKLVSQVSGAAAETALDKILELYTVEQIADKVDRCEWDLITTDEMTSLTIYI